MHEKEKKNTANGGWHGESTENVVVHFCGSVETVIPEMRRVSTAEDGGYA